MTTIGSLFSGYGGLDGGVAAAVGGARVAWVSDIDRGACRILAHRYPDTPNLGDITTAHWADVEPVDVLTGGFPCQDVSVAGLRSGLHPTTRSGLWTHMAYAIDQLRPRLVVAENVRGLLSAEAHSDVEPCPWCLGNTDGEPPMRALGAVLADLADLGYDAQWHGLRAADVGAPHGRFRIFVVAWPAADAPGHRWREGRPEPARVVRGPHAPVGGDVAAADTDRAGLEGRFAVRRRGDERPAGPDGLAVRWGKYTPAIARWQHVTGRVAPAPTDTAPKGGQRLSPRFVEWMMGLPAGHVTDVPGLSRNDQLKALGNGVVPQQAEAAVRHILAARANEVDICLVCTDGLDCPDLQAALTDTGDLLELLEDDD